MDSWDLICLLCKVVCQEQNVFLDIFIDHDGIQLQLMPMGEELENGEDYD